MDFSRKVALELRRITGVYFSNALECLERCPGATSEDAIHQFRKTTKKLRAVLRLISGRAARSERRRWLRVLRVTSEQLSASRDFVVLEQNLRSAYQSLMPNLDLSTRPWANLSLLERVPKQQGAAPSPPQLDAIRMALNDAARDVAESPHLNIEAYALLRGVVKSYQRGRRILRRMDASPSTEVLHELRKRVKDQLYQLRLIANLSPKQLRTEAVEFDLLAELLGEHHDLANLKALIDASRATFCSVVEPAGLVHWTSQRLTELETEALALARRLYFDPPTSRLRLLTSLYAAELPKTSEACS